LRRAIDRREFIAGSAAAFLGMTATKAFGEESDFDQLGAIGLQLYTLREMMPRGVAATLSAVAKTGYAEVEFAGYFGHSARDIRKTLDDNGLSSPSAHVQMTDLTDKWDAMLDFAAVVGHKYLTVAWIDQPDRTLSGYKRIAALFNSAGERARRAGIQFAYHNYNYEFTPLDGVVPYQLLLDHCPAENLVMEPDVFWMRQAGQNPVDWFAKAPGRFHMLHVKDMGPPPRNEMLDVGDGVVDWRAILSRQKEAGVRHVFVENDEPKEMLASIARSYRYLRALRY
jgi:sugar phosphate isomerase/epimerase